ncbi:MAG: HAMP domain-containing sensor histidine kinase [Spirochaetia bacterium]|jgi:signal transduction histidine kinase
MESPLGMLRDLYFFRSLSAEELEKVGAVCREECFAAGDMICREGTPADKFFIMVSGTVEVWKDWGDPEADLLALHGPGHMFGEMALIDELPRSATVIAREQTRLLSIGRGDFHRIIRENASVALSVMRSVSSMVRISNENFVESLRKRNRELVRTNRQLKNAQSRLLRAERLSLLGRFSSLILHDIRNPISILRGSAEMILLHPSDAGMRERNINRIIEEADRLNSIAGELLDYSRGEISLNIAIVDLRDLVDRAMQIVAERFASRKIEIRTDVEYRGPVLLDYDRMLRVLLNLADNSRKAMPRGGTFTVSVLREGKNLVIQVSDTGEGMDQEVQARLFEPFYTSSREGGTGLGMSIVKSIVDAHEGSLSFTSRKNEGTTFRVTIPLPG